MHIFINDTYLVLLQITEKRLKTKPKKMHERLKQTPHKGDIQMINKHMKRWSTLLIIMEIKLPHWETITHSPRMANM